MKNCPVRPFIFILLLLPLYSFAQKDSTVLLTKNFKFEDGIYLSFSEFQQNQPSISWDSVFARLHTNPQNFVTLVETIHLKATKASIKGIWGFSLGGIPYINVEKKNEAGLHKYVGLKVRGSICYYVMEEKYEQSETITAYNPLTGVPFRQAQIMTEKKRERPFMMSFKSGKKADFVEDNFLKWIEDDAKLVKTVQNLKDADRAEKLFKCLLIYIDRNPAYVPVRE